MSEFCYKTISYSVFSTIKGYFQAGSTLFPA